MPWEKYSRCLAVCINTTSLVRSSVEAQQPVRKAVWPSHGDVNSSPTRALNFDLCLAYMDFESSSAQDAKLQSKKAKEPLHLRPANGSADRDSCGFRGHQPLVGF